MAEHLTYQIRPEILTFMRKSSGMTEDDVAKKLKLSTAKYLNIEKCEYMLDIHHACSSYVYSNYIVIKTSIYSNFRLKNFIFSEKNTTDKKPPQYALI